MKNNLWQILWQSFNQINGWVLGFASIVITIILTRFPFKTNISLDLVIIITLFTLLFIFILFYAVNHLVTDNRKLQLELQEEKQKNQILINELEKVKLPRILRVQKDENTEEIICLFENSDLFANQLMISIFYRDENEFEASIGVGYIKSIQTNNKIQAVIDKPVLSYKDILDKLVNNDRKILEQTTVRPGTLKQFNKP